MPRWVIHTILTMLLWGAWGVLSKPASNALTGWQVQALSALGLIPVAVVALWSKNLWSGPSNRAGFWLSLAAGVVGSLGNVAYFQSFALGAKAAAVTPLTALYPIVTIALAVTFLGERLNAIQAAGTVLCLSAIYCFNVGPGSDFLTAWLGLALVPIGFWGVSGFLQKLATTKASVELATAAFLLGELPVALVTPVFVPVSLNLPLSTWILLLSLGLFFGLGNLTLILAYASGGKASIVTPLSSLYAVVTIPMAVLVLGERVSLREGLGIVLALIAVAALCWEKSPPATATPNVNSV